MRIVILGDCHLGARNGSNHFQQYFNRFFNEILYPYCQKNDVKHILQLGDLFDNRTNLTYKSFHTCRDVWFKQMGDLGINMTMLLGNHDIAYRHSLEINSPELLLGEYEHICIINQPTQIAIDGVKFDIIPWLCEENEAQIQEFVKRKDKGEILLGHLELSGFPHSKHDKNNDFTEQNAVLKKYGIDEEINSEEDYHNLLSRIRTLKSSSKTPT